MTNKDKKVLQDKIDIEGFDYCFQHYSDWEEIKDKKFHQLRLDYLDAVEKLEKYIQIE